ncbi:MAG: MBOAT family protein [Candidatus Hydrogenedentes bacterium]|nr:MBOAT family protein [Candidatus Hydrogenedentota bacterium]
MLFNSIEFVIFFPLVLIVCFSLPWRWQWVFLLAASYAFYMAWKPAYIILILISTAIDYWAGLALGATRDPRRRKLLLILSMSSNLGLLFTYKYLDFFLRSAGWVCDLAHLPVDIPVLNLLLPVGISFYSFQSMSYTIDVFLERQKPERNFGRFALYVTFFPQLVAGPIERSGSLLPQLRQHFTFDSALMYSGLRLILWGLFKKMVIADRLAIIVNRVYETPFYFEGPILIIATVCFAFQIYCDFSGYSDIAIGAARTLNVDLMRNFNRPYTARSIQEFWSRWHISLSTWFRDYVYIPLGGNRTGRTRQSVNILAVFGLSGLWHGANWTFVIWGLLHAAYYLAQQWTARPRKWFYEKTGLARLPRVRAALEIAVTFTLVNVGWVFFRAASMKEAVYICLASFQGWDAFLGPGGWLALEARLRIYPDNLLTICWPLAVLLIGEWASEKPWFDRVINDTPAWVRYPAYAVLCLIIMNMGVVNEASFIYFQF